MIDYQRRTQMPLRTHSNFARSAVFLEGEPPRFPPGGDPGGELTGTYVQEGVLRWGCGGAEPPRSRPAQRKKMGSIGCLKRFSTED